MAKRPLLSLLALTAVFAPGLATAQTTNDAIEARVEAGLKSLTLEEKIALIGGVDGFAIREIPKVGLPRMKMSDGPVGVRNFGKTTAYPATIALAATFDPELGRRYGVAIGRDGRARGVYIQLAPGVNLLRVPQNGRNFEYLGEDPLVASRMVVGYIQGVQSQGVSATVKHFLGNEHENDRNNDSTEMSDRTLRELYLRPFDAAVHEGQVQCVMSSYNLFRGVHTSESKYLVQDILKGEFGFKGIYMSDWGAAHSTLGTFKYGLDLEMPGPDFMNLTALRPLLASGQVSEAMLDDKVRRILRVAFVMQWDKRSQLDETIPKADPQGEATALDVARSGTVLLKNRGGMLPLTTKTRKILVIGPNATPAVTGGGGSSYTDPTTPISLADAILREVPRGTQVTVKKGVPDLEPIFGMTHFLPPRNEAGSGLRVEYFANTNLEGAPAVTGSSYRIDSNWGQGSPVAGLPIDHFSIRWTGRYRATVSGSYTVAARSDDGIRVFVDGKRVIDAWKDRGAETDVAKIQLEGGKDYDVRVEYYDNGSDAIARVGIAPDTALKGDLSDADLRAADAIVYSGGFNSSSEGEGFDRSFELTTVQQELLARAVRLNKNVVIVNNSGGPVDLAAYEKGAAGIVQAWYPGGNGNIAVAEILFGKTNPSGKLPMSWPRTLKGTYYANAYPSKAKKMVYDEGLFMGYRWFDANRVAPLYPFGFGLSYTKFALSGLKIEAGKDGLQAVVTVKNTGARAGSETVQLYSGYVAGAVKRPVKELKAFQKVMLAPGESKTIALAVPRKWLAYWDVSKSAWAVEPGEMRFSVGTSSRDLPLTAKYVWR